MVHQIAELFEEVRNDKQVVKWIKAFSKVEKIKFGVIKVSGESIDNYLDDICNDIAIMARLDLYTPIVYGWGKSLNKRLKEKGIESLWHSETGDRITTRKVMPYVEEIAREYGSKLVGCLRKKKVKANLCYGVFNAVCNVWDDVNEEHMTGKIIEIDTTEIKGLIDLGIIPVVCPLGTSTKGYLNVNGDSAAKEVVYDIRPLKYIAITNTGGILDLNGDIIPNIEITNDYHRLIEEGIVKEGMKKKLDEAKEILKKLKEDGYEHTVQIAHPKNIINELFTDRGKGTFIYLR